MTYQSDNLFDATAIRLEPLLDTAGALAGLRPVVLFAQQGASSAGLERPTAAAPSGGDGAEQFFAGSYANHQKNDPIGKLTPQFELSRVIFIIDRSGSMADRVSPGSASDKIGYIKDKISRFHQDYLPPSCQISVIDFDNVANPVECGRVDAGGLGNLKLEVSRLTARSGTEFSPPLQEAHTILMHDQENARAAGIPVAEVGLRSAIVFLTDGDDRGESHVLQLCKMARDANAMMFVGGIGANYKMARILEMASHAGASTWAHMPPEKGAPDVFDVQLPRFFQQIQSSEHYFSFQAEGTFDRFSALAPSIRFALPRRGEIYSGYEQEPVGILFEKQEDLKLQLTAGRTVDDKSPYRYDIDIVDADKAVGLYEQVMKARDLSERFLILKAMLDRDVNALRAMIDINPDLADILGEAVNDMDEQVRHGNYDYGTQSMYSSMSSVGGYTVMGMNLPPAPQQPNPAGDTINHGGANYTVVGGMTNPGKNKDDKGNPPGDMLHSGFVGPLSAPPPEHSMDAPSHFDAAPYKNLQPIPEVPLLEWKGGYFFQAQGLPTSEISLDQLLYGKNYAFGRSGSAGDVKVVLGYDTISRNHFRILTRDGKFFVEDLNSMNGTSLNGASIRKKGQVEIRFGDVISFCNFPPITFKAPTMA